MPGAGSIPVPRVDVWEHAYYLNYQNQNQIILKLFFGVINWTEVARRYAIEINRLIVCDVKSKVKLNLMI
jgi:superoxide dismutase